MSEYRANSQRSREEKTVQPPAQKIESVVTGPTVIRKKTGLSKLTDIFVKQDMSKVKEYIFGEIIVPKTKMLLDEMVVYIKDILIYGEYRGGVRSNSTGSKVSYRQYFDSNERRSAPMRAQSAASYDDILFSNKGDATLVLSTMEDILARYQLVKVSDMFDLAHLPCDYTLNRYGWVDLSTAEVVAVQGGYVIKLPRAMPIN